MCITVSNTFRKTSYRSDSGKSIPRSLRSVNNWFWHRNKETAYRSSPSHYTNIYPSYEDYPVGSVGKVHDGTLRGVVRHIECKDRII